MGHVCDNPNDIMDPGGNPLASPRLRDSILDAGRDDYYDHPGTWWDVRNSPFLSHLDTPPVVLTLGVAGGQGVLQTDQPGPACADHCDANWDAGTAVTVHATPAAGFGFLEWDGACSGTAASCPITMDAAHTVTAYFGALDSTPVVVKGKGTVAGGGSSCARRCAWASVDGRSMLVTATPQKGWRFAGWRGACRGTQRVCAFATEPGVSLSATFVPR
jgi:hypothetical protein